jgi:hypothetical protein
MSSDTTRWTPARGLRNLGLSLLVRGGLVAVIVAGLAALAWTPGLEPFVTDIAGLLAGLVLGVPLGAILSVRLTEQAGFSGPFVTFAAFLVAVVAGIVGVSLAESFTDPDRVRELITLPAGALGGAVGAILKFTLVES